MEEKIIWRAVGRNRFAKVLVTDSSNKILATGDTQDEALSNIGKEKTWLLSPEQKPVN